MKVAINKCYGGFGVTEEVFKELGIKWGSFEYLHNENFGIESDNWHAFRSDKRLIDAIEKIGVEKASGEYAEIRIVEIPNDCVNWYIDEYDGIETIHEDHRSW